LALVLRVYCEDQLMDNVDGSYVHDYAPSALLDAENCKKDLKEETPAPSEYRKKTFEKLINFIVGDLNEEDYEFQGPVLKPLQSLFNKMFIRRGQTSVSVIGDMTRATLLIKSMDDLSRILKRIKENISDDIVRNFEGPGIIGVKEFLEQVFKMKKVPNTEIIPYRFKHNSSQNEEDALLYNLNFFDGIPEYHRIGTTEIFVAFELQIGLKAEVSRLRKDHDAYEGRRILKAQPLLKHYKEAQTDSNNVNKSKTSFPSSLIEESEHQDDVELISAVLGGNFSNCKYRALGKKEIGGIGTIPMPPARLCLNNKRLNAWGKEEKAVILDGPLYLDSSQRYSVESMSFEMEKRIYGISVGLFAHFGPYMFQLSAQFLGQNHTEDISLIRPQVNYLTMESISMLPPKCCGVILVAWGEPCNYYRRKDITWMELKEYYYGMKLVLNRYEEMAE